jgi:Ser/Thr protein kinase RdoA (MazF antagonist)
MASIETIEKLVAGSYAVQNPRCILIQKGLNDTYEVRTGGDHTILRIHRPGWRIEEEIQFELDFIWHLADRSVPVSFPLPNRVGQYTSPIELDGKPTFATLFSFAAGTRPSLSLENARLMGVAAAQLHQASDDFSSEHSRFALDTAHLLVEPLTALEDYLVNEPEAIYLLRTVVAFLKLDIEEVVSDLEWGPCHGDLHEHNAHADSDGNLTLFDFDCCGFGWRAYDIAVFKWASRREPNADELWETYLSGYQSVRTLSEADLKAVPIFVMVRHIWLAGVHASNPDVFGAGVISEGYLKGFLDDVRDYFKGQVDGGGLPTKMSDCMSKDSAKAELYIVRSDWIGETIKVNRDRMTQAVLFLSDNMVDLGTVEIDAMLDDEDCKSLIACLGIGLDLGFGPGGETGFDLNYLRYGKVILAMDDSPEGTHVRKQALALITTYMEPMVKAGHVYTMHLGELKDVPDTEFERIVMKPDTRSIYPYLLDSD